MLKFLLLVLVILLLPIPAHAQFLTNEVPLWEGVEKSAEDLKNDEQLVKRSIELAGDRKTAVEFAIRLAWSEVSKNDPNSAIRRFNQAALIDPDQPQIYWGFAIATHIRGDELKDVERWIARTKSMIKTDPRIYSDHGRILGERQMPEKAKPLFEEALALDPNYLPAHMGMIRVAQMLGDKPLEEKHQKRHDELTGKTE